MALGPLMEEYGVQAYFCGHEHNLQYLHKEGEPTHYIVSGGGSQVGQYGNGTGPDLLMFHPSSGKLHSLAIAPVLVNTWWQHTHADTSASALVLCGGICPPQDMHTGLDLKQSKRALPTSQ